MIDLLLPPGLLLIAAAFLLPLVKESIRPWLVLGFPLLTLLLIWTIPDGATASVQFLEYELTPVAATATGRLFATIFAIMTLVGGLYALYQARLVELCAAFAYAGSAIGVTFAGDLISLFVFWEMMALGSTLVLWSAGTVGAYRASMRYLLVHLFGGVVLMFGIIGHVYQTGDIQFGAISLDSWAQWLILAGFLINAGAPPLSAWIADAYPEASPTGMVFLSAFTTKTAVFTLMVAFAGTEILIYIGLYMVFYGIIYALLENDMRRILAYSIVNQVGFMVVAIGIGTELALNGAAAHAFAHIIYKGLLLMSAGAVLWQTGERKCSHLGGLFQSMPITAAHGIIGALAISAFPFTSGFVTKSLEASAAAHEGLAFVWFCLMAASAGVFLHAGIKFPWFVFFQKDSGLRPADPPRNMRYAMAIFSFFCIAIGVFPAAIYQILPYDVAYQPYTFDHLVSQFQLLLFAGFAFFAFLPMMKRTMTISLDFDWFYRRFIPKSSRYIGVIIRVYNKRYSRLLKRSMHGVLDYMNHHIPTGLLSGARSSSSMVLWVAAIFALCLGLSFF